MDRKMRRLRRTLLWAGVLCGLLGLNTGSARVAGTDRTEPSILANRVVTAVADKRDDDTPEPVTLALFGSGLVLVGGIIRPRRVR
jgi:hypothetical protein